MLTLSWQTPAGPRSAAFEVGCVIGRGESCDLRIEEEGVSKQHVELRRSGSHWLVRDLGSTNGTLLDGRPIKVATVSQDATVQLGAGGPVLQMSLGGGAHAPGAGAGEPSDQQDRTVITARSGTPRPAVSPTGPAGNPEGAGSVTQFVRRYLESPDADGDSEHAQVVRRAFERVQKRKTRKYRGLLAFGAVLLLGALAFAGYQHNRMSNMRALAIDIFYNMKSLEVELHAVAKSVARSGQKQELERLMNSRKQLAAMSDRYDSFVREIGALDKAASPQQRAVLRMARILGECELNVPDRFMTEVLRYVELWKSSDRLRSAIVRADRAGYIPTIKTALEARNLPPQFFYLALQESNFHTTAVGPETRYGIAKGMWQFIPGTAVDHGLRLGPLAEQREFDPDDERHDFKRSTEAAADYLETIYGTEAQASGLLVMAGYNWGHNRVRRLINKMPADPRSRNFWALISNNTIPDETYDYVFYIFSAAVIGEDPALFGFDFEPPLKS